jgi:hypothetical protein
VVDPARELDCDLHAVLDVTIVNVALPSIERSLGANFSDLQ